jgi:acyl-CoA thioesterase
VSDAGDAPAAKPRVIRSAEVTPEQALAEQVVQKMLDADAFSAWLGVSVLSVAPGKSKLRMVVRPEMVNGFGTAHGGIAYSLADSALAFATNTGGTISVALDTTMSYPAAVRVGDVLMATCVEENRTNKIGFARVTVTNQNGETVGHFRGTVYRTPKPHFPPEQG